MRPWGVALLTLLTLAVMASPASGHGGEDLTEQPARALTQQALGLLTQGGDHAEAQERLEAALESQNAENVQLSSVRSAIASLEAGETDRAVEELNQALAPQEQPAPDEGPPSDEAAEGDPGHEEGPAPADGAGATTEPAEEALEDHTNAVEPDRGSAEWIALFVGIGLLGGGGVLLARGRNGA